MGFRPKRQDLVIGGNTTTRYQIYCTNHFAAKNTAVIVIVQYSRAIIQFQLFIIL
jgi:hypothetical protein